MEKTYTAREVRERDRLIEAALANEPVAAPSIVSYQSTGDGRLVVLGSNGRLYWYHSIWTENKELHQEWCIYPELPIEAKVNPFKD